MTRSESASITIGRRRSGTSDSEGEPTVVWVSGDQDIATNVSLVVAIARAAGRADVDVVVDLSGVTFMDASTVSALVGSQGRLHARSQSLRLQAPSRRAARVLDLCGVTHLFDINSDAPEAAHPVGAAAALSTWVDVTPTAPGPSAVDEPPPTSERLPSPVSATAKARLATAGPTIDADRDGP